MVALTPGGVTRPRRRALWRALVAGLAAVGRRRARRRGETMLMPPTVPPQGALYKFWMWN